MDKSTLVLFAARKGRTPQEEKKDRRVGCSSICSNDWGNPGVMLDLNARVLKV
jgi:hypothetical protein